MSLTFEMVTSWCWVQNINQQGLFPQICHLKLRKIRKFFKKWCLFANAPRRAAFFWKLMIVEIKSEINQRFRLSLPLSVLVYYRKHAQMTCRTVKLSYHSVLFFISATMDSKIPQNLIKVIFCRPFDNIRFDNVR